MGHDNSSEGLADEAGRVLGGTEVVQAAGIFGLQDLMAAQMVGNVAGGVGAGALGAGVGVDAVAVGLGGLAAKKAAAAAQGVTLQLIVAVTDQHLYVLNRDAEGRLPDVVASFDRATAHVQVSKFGLSRIITITSPDGNESITLHGSTGPFSSFAKADAVVLHLLAT
jgi:hypothetical protein